MRHLAPQLRSALAVLALALVCLAASAASHLGF
jgi:hypothetical protein